MSQEDRATGLVGYSGVKVPVRVATTANLAALSGLLTVDGVVLAQDDRVLVKNQTSSIDNGIYIADSGAWNRAPDADGPYDFIQGSLVPVYAGTANAGTLFQQTTASPVPDTTALTFTSYLTLIGTPVSIANGGTGAATAAAARSSLGIPANTVAQGDTAFATGGAAPNFTLTPTPALGAYAANVRYRVKFGAAGAGNDQLNVSALGAKNLKVYNSAGAKTATTASTIVNGMLTDVEYDGVDFVILDQLPAAATTTPLPRGYLAGCGLTNSAGDLTNDIDIAVGACRDSTDAANITVTAKTKQLDANWAAGTNVGGRYSGAAIANTTYGVWAASKADGTQDVYYYPNSGAPSAATVLAALQAETGGASYLYVRRIGCILREGGAIVPFKQLGDLFTRDIPISDVNVTNPGTSAVTRTVSVPIGLTCQAWFSSYEQGVSAAYWAIYTALDQTDTAPSTTLFSVSALDSVAGSVGHGGDFYVKTNTSAQFRTRCSASGASNASAYTTKGWIDRRERDN